MAIDVGSAIAYLDLNTSGFESALSGAESTLRGFTSSVTAGLDSLGTGMTRMGTSLTAAITVPVAGLGTAIVKTTADFDESMSKVQALSGATGEDFERLRQKAIEMGGSTRYSATEAADALGYMALAGWDTQQMIDGLPGILDLAASSQMDLAQASDIVTDYLTAFGKEADYSSHMADMLAYAQANSNMTTQDLADAFGNSAAMMNSAGQEMSTTIALLGAMADQGTKGSEAGTALSAVVRDITQKMVLFDDEMKITKAQQEGLVSSTGNLNDLLGRNAIQIGDVLIPVDDLNGNFRDMILIMRDVEDATNGMGTAQRASALMNTFTARSIKAVSEVLESGSRDALWFKHTVESSSVTMESFYEEADKLGIPLRDLQKELEKTGISQERFEEMLSYSYGSADDFVENLEEISANCEDVQNSMDKLGITTEGLQQAMDNASGSAKEMSEIMLDNLNGAITYLKSNVQTLMIRLGDILTPKVKEIVNHINNIVTKLNQLSDAQLEQIIRIAAVAASIGPALLVMGKVVKSISSIIKIAQLLFSVLGGFNPVILAIVAGIALLIAGFVNAYKESEEFRNNVQRLLSGLMEFGKQLFDRLKVFWERMQPTISKLIDIVTEIAEIVMEVLADLWDAIGPIIMELIDLVLTLVEIILPPLVDIIKALLDLIKACMPVIKFVIEVVGELARILIVILKPAIEAVHVVLAIVLELIAILIEAFAALVEAIVGFFSNFSENMQNLGKSISDWVNKTFSTIASWVSDVINVFSKFFSQLWNDFTSWLSNVWNKISSWFSNLMSTIGNFFSNVFSAIGNFFSNAFSAISNFFSNAFNSLVNFISNIISNVTSFFSNLFANIGSFISNAISSITNFFSNIVSKVSSFISNIISNVGSFLSNLISNLAQAFSNIISSVGDMLSNIFSSITDWLSNALQTVSQWFTNLCSKFKNWGSDLFKNLWNGLKEMWQKIWGWITGIVDNVKNAFSNIGNSIKNVISGSHANGLDYVPYDGYVAELHQGERVLTKAEAASYNSGSGSGGNTINIYSYEKLDEYESAKQMKRAMKQLELGF